jgi:hypothetical protein
LLLLHLLTLLWLVVVEELAVKVAMVLMVEEVLVDIWLVQVYLLQLETHTPLL